MTKKYAFMLTAGFAFFISMAVWLPVPDLALGGEPPALGGVQIHKSTVKGHGFAYTLYHFPERKTWHLMVAITNPEGSKVEKGKVGFLVVAPDGSNQKAMAMGMKGSYGADMDFGTTGTYKIKLKTLVGDKKLFDEFIYDMR